MAKSEKCSVIQNVVEDFYTSLLNDGTLKIYNNIEKEMLGTNFRIAQRYNQMMAVSSQQKLSVYHKHRNRQS